MGKNYNRNNDTHEEFAKDMEAPAEAETNEVVETTVVEYPVSEAAPEPVAKPESKKESIKIPEKPKEKPITTKKVKGPVKL